MEKRTFAIDLGASGGKCFIGVFKSGSFNIKEVHRFSHETATFWLPTHTGELTERTFWDDTFLYQQIIKGLKVYRREVSDKLDSVGIDTWGTDGQFITEDGDLLTKVYCYRDHRLDHMIEEVMKRIDRRKIYEITGIHFQPFNISNQLLWFVLNRPYLLSIKGLKFLPSPTLFAYYLSGATSIDSSWASVTQLMDARKKEWSDEVLKALEIPKKLFPEIVEPGTPLGMLSKPLSERLRLNDVSIIAVGAHDTASAFAAAPVEKRDEALIISSGTWSLIGKLIPNPITSEKAMEANLSNEGGIGNIRLLKNCMGTWLIQELLRIWAEEDGKLMSWSEVLQLAEKAPAFSAFIDPDDPGFYNPPNMEEAIISFCKKTGQQPPQGRGSFLRTVYESLALKYQWVNNQIIAVTGLPNKVVHIVGGGSKNELLNQFAANATGLKVIAGPSEATACGNCLVQALGLGVVRSMKEACHLIRDAFSIKEYLPRSENSWAKAYEKFKEFCST